MVMMNGMRMKKKMFDIWLGAFVSSIFTVGLIMVVYVAPHTTDNKTWQGFAIERGYGLYCPNTGNFAWIDECD